MTAKEALTSILLPPIQLGDIGIVLILAITLGTVGWLIGKRIQDPYTKSGDSSTTLPAAILASVGLVFTICYIVDNTRAHMAVQILTRVAEGRAQITKIESTSETGDLSISTQETSGMELGVPIILKQSPAKITRHEAARIQTEVFAPRGLPLR